jgi:hypothetical protein
MNPTTRGLSTAAKTGVVVVLIVIVLGGAYLAPSLSKGTSTTALSCGSGSNAGGGNQTLTLLSLFGCFSQMQLQITISDQAGAIPQQEIMSYRVLGQASFNSTQHTKVDFSQTGAANHEVVAWFNPGGVVDRLDILGGGRNYTGPGAAIFAQTYTTAFSIVTDTSNNATLLSLLSKTTENTTSIGGTQLNAATYHLAVPSPPFKTITAEYATIPGTHQRLAVYLDEKMTDGTRKTFQVLSLTK